MSGREPYLAALRFRWLTPFYDRLLGAFLREKPLKARLIRQAGLEPGQRVLDLGSGTGTLTIMAQQAVPGAVVIGVDGDLATLAIARAKGRATGVPLRLCVALGQDLPFADSVFDRALSSLFFHHLLRPSKREVAAAVRRALAAGGEFHILDWGKAHDPLMRLMFVLVQLLDGFQTTGDNVRGRLVELLAEGGFTRVRETGRERSILGTLSLYEAVNQGTEPAR